MTNRDRRDRGERQDWASEVPWHYGRRGPYEDWGWERGQSVLPEFRDPSVHEHQPPFRGERYSREAGRRDEMRDSRSGSAMDAQRRNMMRNPYDDDMGYDRTRYGRDYSRGYGRDSDYDRMRGDQGSYGGMYNRDYDYNRGGMGQGSYGRDYDYDRMRGSQGSYSGMYNRDYDYNRGGMGQGSYGRDYDYNRNYDYNRGGMGSYGDYGYGRGDYGYGRGDNSQGGYDYGRSLSQGSYGGTPVTWSYTEYWLIPGPYTGRGPQGYQRSDERIREDVCERLTQHGQLDAWNIQIDVENGEVTLRGSVDQRQAKRMAEDAAESVSGVREVRNELRVKQEQESTSNQRGDQTMSSTQNTSNQSNMQRSVGGTENRG